MSNIFYSPSGTPAPGAFGLSALVRNEFIAISAGFDLVSTAGVPVAAFNAGFLVWWASLPTTKPGTAGIAWNNGGVLCVS